jgi:integrase
MTRQQLPPQIKKISVSDRSTGKPVVRYQVVVDAGADPKTGKRRQIRRRFTTEKAARTELARVQSGVQAGTHVHRSATTVDTVCEAWLASKHSLKESTIAGHRSKLKVLRAELGHVEVQKLSKANLDVLVGRLRSGEAKGCRRPWTARSCNYLLYLITAVLDDQMRQGKLVRNVADLVDRVTGEPKPKVTLTAAQMVKILDHDCRDRHLWTLALYGLRRGEISGLRWVNVNLTGKQIGEGDDALPAKSLRISENRVVIGKEIVTGTPKSMASRRTLPLPDEVVDALKAAHKRHLEERLAFGPGYGEDGYVACDETGQPYHPNLIYFRWGKMLKSLKIKTVRLHEARHTCGTLMHLRGVPIAVIAAWLGHASAAFTMATYVHSQDDALKDAANSLSRPRRRRRSAPNTS